MFSYLNLGSRYLKGILKLLRKTGLKGIFKTVYWNFKLFPFGVACRFPLIVSSYCVLSDCKRGCIQLVADKIKPGILIFGVTNFKYTFKETTVLSIHGILVIRGGGRHSFAEGGQMIIRKSGILEIDDDYSIGRHWNFMISSHSTIGKHNLHSWNVSIFDTDGHYIMNGHGEMINHPAGLNIGNNVWIGSGCTILKGTCIPDGCILAAKSTVTRKLETPESIYINNKIVRTDINWNIRQL